MNTALVVSRRHVHHPAGRTPDAAHADSPVGVALSPATANGAVASSGEYSREELAELHERRREAERLRDERYSGVALQRMM